MKFYQNIIISLRRFRSEKVNTLISITGLVLALSIVTVVLVFILNELNYNSFYKNKDRIYRVLNHSKVENKYWATNPYQIGQLAKEKFSEVIAATHQYNIHNTQFEKSNEYIEEESVMGTDSSFFKVFGVKILQGDLKGFNETKDQIILSAAMAKKYFGRENPVGQDLKMKMNNQEYHMQVAAIFEDIPNNASVNPKFIVNTDMAFEDLEKNIITGGDKVDRKSMKEAWTSVFFSNYLLLNESASIPQFQKKLLQLGNEYSNSNKKFNLSAQSLSDVYFKSKGYIDNHSTGSGDLNMLFILGSIGILILIIACINYLNLALAQALTRLKSFAVRKTYGASQKDILQQLVFDYCLLSILSLPFALALAQVALPLVSEMLGKSYALQIDASFITGFCILIALTAITGLITASATFLKFKHSELTVMLKGGKVNQNRKIPLQKAMIVFQILIFIVLLSSTILIQKQVIYGFNKDLGFAKEELVNVNIGNRDKAILKQKLLQIPSVKSVSSAMWLPPTDNKMYIGIQRVDRPDEQTSVSGLFVDYDFATTMGIELLSGEDFQLDKHNSGVLVNQSAAKALGIKDVIGTETSFGTVRGLIADFHMFSLKEEIPPMILNLSPSSGRQMIIRISTQNIPHTIDQIKNTWESFEGGDPFDITFTDDALNEIYESEIRFSKTIGILAFIAILIASLGLLGLSLFSGKQRIKEIGVRKSNGAKTIEIVQMLNQDFMKLVIIAFILACPIAWFIMKQWLQNFAFKTEMSWWIFALSGIIAMSISILTVTWQSWRAARRNPVESLRYE
jgi:putative ABC transport system permease protein